MVERFGADRILWGSNFPAAEGDLAVLLDEAKAGLAVLPEADRAAILAGSARRLYPGLGAPRHG
ncbi:putative TIM-barrel fold metal-dependent hydrolase [Inquilinus ginsengisoli]|uniref:TIM-barrel fold metal-dependent hydrolase n=1 Tax=Inquilinus ginsengisoli TaxID=363840 RepID=A0ABU1JIG2_9PROT|nr:putative TIM-barrel fold metal-dependent hydrolase [Inquilinus ginsengisoli]